GVFIPQKFLPLCTAHPRFSRLAADAAVFSNGSYVCESMVFCAFCLLSKLCVDLDSSLHQRIGQSRLRATRCKSCEGLTATGRPTHPTSHGPLMQPPWA